MAIVVRALGGSIARKLRAVLPERALKGEKLAETEVRYLVNMLQGRRETIAGNRKLPGVI